MTPEGKLKTQIKTYFKTLIKSGAHLFYFMPMSMGYGKRGVPDFIVCFNGKFVGIETKSGNAKPTPWQQQCRNEILLADGMCFPVWSIEDVKKVIH